MSDNITVYTVGGEVEKLASGSVDVGFKDQMFTSDSAGASMQFVLSPISSSDPEISRMNAFLSETLQYGQFEGNSQWTSFSGRETSSPTLSQYGNGLMVQPAIGIKQYYSKPSAFVSEADPKFTKYVYVLNADTSFLGSQLLWPNGPYDSVYRGRQVIANQYNVFNALIPVGNKGKIRDLKVWIELVHRNRGTTDQLGGLSSLQIGLISPNVSFDGAYPLWNAPSANTYLYDANQNLSGVDGLVGNRYQNTQPTILAGGTYILWDGHTASPALNYATTNLGLQGDWHEFDTDFDMRTIFSDSSQNENPRNRLQVFQNASDTDPGEASNLSATLICNLQPLNYYYSPSNYAQRNYSSSLSWGNLSASLTGDYVPWYVDPSLPSGSLISPLVGAPPDGWVSGEPNALFGIWNDGILNNGNQNIQWATVKYDALSGESNMLLGEWGQNNTCPSPGDTVQVGNGANAEFVKITNMINYGNYAPPSLPSTGGLTSDTGYLYTLCSYLLNGHPVGEPVYITNGVTYQYDGHFDNPASWMTWFPAWYAATKNYVSTGQKFVNTRILIAFTSTSDPMFTPGNYINWTVFNGAPGNTAGIPQVFKISSVDHNFIWNRNYDQVLNSYYNPIGGMTALYLETAISLDLIKGISPYDPSTYWLYGGGISGTTAVTAVGTTAGEYGLEAFGLSNRWGFSYAFDPPNTIMLIGGYTGTIDNPISANFVDFLYFSGAYLTSAFQTGTISNAPADGGTKAIRLRGKSFVINLAGSTSKFYAVVGGGVTNTLAITSSVLTTYSSAIVASVTYSAPYNYQYWQAMQYTQDPRWFNSPTYNLENYYASVPGYSLVQITDPTADAIWSRFDTLHIGSPNGFACSYYDRNYTILDDQPNLALYTAYTVEGAALGSPSSSCPRPHPSQGNAAWTTNTQSPGYSPGIAFGDYNTTNGDSPVLNGLQRDATPGIDQFIVLNTNLTSLVQRGTVIYNTNNVIAVGGGGVDMTASWREIQNTILPGSAVGNAFVEVTTDDGTRSIIYAFGGENSTNFYNNNILWSSASLTFNDNTKIDISPWYYQDVDKNSWAWASSPTTAFPNAGGPALTIPGIGGIDWGSLANDTTTNTIYYGGGVKPLFAGSTSSVWGVRDVWGWHYDGVTGLLTGGAFYAGQMPAGRYKHECIAANGFVYFVGGMSASYDPTAGAGAALTQAFNLYVDRAFIGEDGVLIDWATSQYEMPQGLNVVETGSGIVDGASFIYPFDAVATQDRYIHIIGGLKEWTSANSFLSRSSNQVYSAKLNFVEGAAVLNNPNKIGIDPTWMGPSSGEYQTTGIQLGPNDIKPALPLMENIYQQLMVSTLPAGEKQVPDSGAPMIGYRPGLKGTEMQGVWQLRISTRPGDFNPDYGPNSTWAILTSSQVYVRQIRLEFLVDTTRGFGDLQYFNPAREYLYKRSSVGLRNGKKLINIISGSAWWDSGVSYVYTHIEDNYGRTVGMTNFSASDDYAVYSQITGALAVYLSGVSGTGNPSWFLNPPPGNGSPGTPYIPYSLAQYGESAAALPLAQSGADMIAATIGQQLPTPADNTLQAYLARTKALQKTQDLFERQLNQTVTGSYF